MSGEIHVAMWGNKLFSIMRLNIGLAVVDQPAMHFQAGRVRDDPIFYLETVASDLRSFPIPPSGADGASTPREIQAPQGPELVDGPFPDAQISATGLVYQHSIELFYR
ncbi:hypothetical protein OIDMADRAFT_31094 [Oidiodendron maius Zn]|uniref:Uncharacterized protein n=1 Tax=Oidiodendron maius (strain Zn) TaxID=913774 RepID=A0A0C3H4K3_OIDMZ|nr:hypothetical protein OIDMADRAFT_31094 [Oidiodendron maius Zn]